ncbi:hypothetical protein CGRA01v4_13836 [Colletotrichum graminicola]|uniref:Uncharacterized protein n=1 Tax=Colletotrichum graminicola (strain M1.001 / M2 / FGSC 10212) TaxID=645133 RepID=E3QU44_COLGM|nr:uncharacterized protein GLRG_09526 [Colletotrichum graminicola M1.001]EFQ34382.1 hypothetical protein GLRG_09526 [Colletotrichum graminicola M1.001]WDK22546.1 hypothetical protein CGRA01v4_13836 [Colletotrichum graminicola]
MKSQLRSSQPATPRRQHQPLESTAGPSQRPDLPFQRTITIRRLCQNPLRCDKGPGLHSHLAQIPRSVAAGLGVTKQKRTRLEQGESRTPNDKRTRAEPERQQQAPDLPLEEGSSGACASRTEDRDRRPGDRLSVRTVEREEQRSALGTSSARPADRRRSGSERQQVPDQALYDCQIEEAFRGLLEKLVHWEISTPEDVQAMKDELDKMAITPAPAPPAAEAEEERSLGPDAVGNEMLPGTEGLEESDDQEQEANKEAESLAFDVVYTLDAGDPGDEYVVYEVEGCLGKAGEDGAGMCHVSYKEVPADMDGEYVLL